MTTLIILLIILVIVAIASWGFAVYNLFNRESRLSSKETKLSLRIYAAKDSLKEDWLSQEQRVKLEGLLSKWEEEVERLKAELEQIKQKKRKRKMLKVLK
ncbi:hypothetical protein FJZ31_29400 [Candidatus Poribacteria bacterium]|nr:hypothetical protein [Candidatus Poribacteria bacterium]